MESRENALRSVKFLRAISPKLNYKPSIDEFVVLLTVWALTETAESVSVSDIQKHTGLALATAVEHTHELERRGFLFRGRNKHDRRLQAIKLTAKGLRVVLSSGYWQT